MLAASSGHTSQSLEDKLYALKYFLIGQGISYVIIKATTTELIGPKKKHVRYLIAASNVTNVSIPSMVKHLVERAKRPEWTVVFKSLITIHQLMLFGSENFLNCFCSSVAYSDPIEKLASFEDRSNSLSYKMSKYLRRYSIYIVLKLHVHRTLGLEFCRIAPTIRMRELTSEQLIKTVPIISELFDKILCFDVTLDDLSNGVINHAFLLLWKEFVKIYIIYQAAILRYLEVYFASDNSKIVRQMLPMYRKYLVRMEKMSDFMPVINAVGLVDKYEELPKFSRVPKIPLQTLEQHLDQLEGSSKRSLGRLDYGSLSRPPRTIKTPSRQTSIDILSPAMMNHFKQHEEELERLDRMLGIKSDGPPAQKSARKHISSFKDVMKPKPHEVIDEVATIADESSFMTNQIDDNDSSSTDSAKESNNSAEQPIVHTEGGDLIDLPSTIDSRTNSDEPQLKGPGQNYRSHHPACDGYDQLLDVDEEPCASQQTRMLDKFDDDDGEDDENEALANWMRA